METDRIKSTGVPTKLDSVFTHSSTETEKLKKKEIIKPKLLV